MRWFFRRIVCIFLGHEWRDDYVFMDVLDPITYKCGRCGKRDGI